MKTGTINRAIAPKARQLCEMPVEERFFGYHLIQPENYILDNGIPVHLFRNSSHSLLKFEMVFKAGGAYQKQLLTACSTNRMLREGTRKYTSAQIADLTEFYGASLLLSCDYDRASIGIISSSEFFESILPLLESMIKEPVFAKKELSNIILRQKQEFLVDLEKTSFLANRSFLSCLFGENNPYGRVAVENDFDVIKTHHLTEFFRSCYHSGNCEIFATCSNNYKILPRINQWFGKSSWGNTNEKLTEPSFDVKPLPGKNINKEGPVQASIRIGKRLPGPGTPDYIPLKIFNTVIGGYFGSRLMKNIREDKGYTYGIGSSVISFERDTYFVINTDVKASVVNETIFEIFSEIQKLQNQLISANELELVKNYMLGNFLQSIEGPFNLAERFKEIRYFGLENNYYKTYLELIRQCSAETLQNIALQYFNPDTMTQVVVGPNYISNINNNK